MTHRDILLLPLAALCVHGTAQTRCIVTDMMTKVPLRDVVVTVGNDSALRTVTTYKGEFTVAEDADSVTIGRTGYETRTLVRGELTDTIELMRKRPGVREVVVYGRSPGIPLSLTTALAADIKKATANVPRPGGIVFDLKSLLTWKKRKRTRQRIKAIENY